MNEEENKVLSGASPIQVKFIGWLVIVCAGGFGGWIWWAASISTKLDVVIQGQGVQANAIRAVVEDVSRLKEWRVQIDTIGSPATVKRLDAVSVELAELVRDFDRHKLMTNVK